MQDELDDESSGMSVVRRNLTVMVLADEKNNDSEIYCRAINLTEIINNNTAYHCLILFFITGPLSTSVGDLSSFINSSLFCSHLIFMQILLHH